MKEALENGLELFCQKMEEFLDQKFSPPEKKRFLEGSFFALDAMTRFATLKIALTPFEREYFILSAKAHIYSKLDQRGENSEIIEDLKKSGWPQIAFCLKAAEELNKKLGIQLNEEEKLQLENAIAMAKR